MSSKALEAKLSRNVFGLKLWVLVCICLGIFIVLILAVMVMWVTFKKKSRRSTNKFTVSQVPVFSKEIKVDEANVECGVSSLQHRPGENGTRKMLGQLVKSKSSEADIVSQCSSVCHNDRGRSSCSGDEGSSGSAKKFYTPNTVLASPLIGLPEFSHLGWGHHFTLRDLEMATNHFSKDNVIGEGGYGIVYRGRLINGTEVAVKKILNHLGQAEKEFSVEVEAIGNVRHKNLVRLLGYCMEGIRRMLVYEYVKNGNLEQWLHGSTHQNGNFSWELRMKVILGTAKALAYLHEAIEPKVVHRDIKSSNILIDDDFNAKLSDFGLAKLLGSEKSFVSTRVMGTFGYVAPEYANTGLLNERSDVYSFGVLLFETVTGRDPVDYNRPSDEVNLVEWLKHMVGIKKVEEVVDPNIHIKPSTRALKRALLIALKCIDPDSDKRPKMSRVVQMLEAEDDPHIEARRKRRSQTASMEIEPLIDSSNSAAAENKQITQGQDSNSHPQ